MSGTSPFRVLPGPDFGVPEAAPLRRVKGLVASSDVFLFMKGSPAAPMCGFSANTVAMLDAVGARYDSLDVLSEPEMRDAAKEFARWPTFPQLFVRGELVGGNDIVSEMFETGELQELVNGLAS